MWLRLLGLGRVAKCERGRRNSQAACRDVGSASRNDAHAVFSRWSVEGKRGRWREGCASRLQGFPRCISANHALELDVFTQSCRVIVVGPDDDARRASQAAARQRSTSGVALRLYQPRLAYRTEQTMNHSGGCSSCSLQARLHQARISR